MTSVIILKFEQSQNTEQLWLYPKWWSESAHFDENYLSQNLGLLQY